VIGNDTVISFGGAFGNFELNTMMPVIAHNLLQSVELLTNASRLFAQRCIAGLEVDVKKCADNVELSLASATALAIEIGYDRVAKLVKTAYETGRSIREVARETGGLPDDKLDQLLNPKNQIGPLGVSPHY